jgi:PleD family two-component response regulator
MDFQEFLAEPVIENNRILIVDDNQKIHEDLKKVLLPSAAKENYEIEDAYQGEEAISKVENAENAGQPYALIFMDVRMPPGINGIEAIAKIWERNPYIEIVICTVYSDSSWNDIIAKLGSTDHLLFLKKSFNSLEVKQMALSLTRKWNLNMQIRKLIANLDMEVKVRTEQLQKVLVKLEKTNQELAEKNQMLMKMIHRDSLTGLLNHAAFFERLNEFINESRRHHFPISLVMIDVDHFKAFNDAYGHQIGDEILKQVAEILKEGLRNFDVVARYGDSDTEKLMELVTESNMVGRYGGDEFVLILAYCGKESAWSLSNRLCQKIKGIQLIQPEVRITASFGAAVLEPGVICDDSKNLLRLADKALYDAKLKGRDQVSVLIYE